MLRFRAFTIYYTLVSFIFNMADNVRVSTPPRRPCSMINGGVERVQSKVIIKRASCLVLLCEGNHIRYTLNWGWYEQKKTPNAFAIRLSALLARTLSAFRKIDLTIRIELNPSLHFLEDNWPQFGRWLKKDDAPELYHGEREAHLPWCRLFRLNAQWVYLARHKW
jgi:hypothetical protein